jgi:hypothetical protein
VKSVQKY